MPKALEVAAAAAKQYQGETLDAALRRGLPVKSAAARYRLSVSTVRRVCEALGIQERSGLAEVMGEEPFRAKKPSPDPREEAERRALGGMVARVVAQPQPAEPPPQPQLVQQLTRPAESTWRVTIRKRMPASKLHQRLQPLLALLSETDGDVVADIFVSDVQAGTT